MDGLNAEVDENPGDAEHITLTFDLSEAGLETIDKLFFRIEEEKDTIEGLRRLREARVKT